MCVCVCVCVQKIILVTRYFLLIDDIPDMKVAPHLKDIHNNNKSYFSSAVSDPNLANTASLLLGEAASSVTAVASTAPAVASTANHGRSDDLDDDDDLMSFLKDDSNF